MNSAIPTPINTPHQRIAAPQRFVESAANRELIIFLAMIGDAASGQFHVTNSSAWPETQSKSNLQSYRKSPTANRHTRQQIR
jgi:hypothetical protein